jgi:hypothetical protein
MSNKVVANKIIKLVYIICTKVLTVLNLSGYNIVF